MKILFIDPTSAYDTTTYLDRPLGGTQSAVSSLAKALVQEGHEIAVINAVHEPIETDGVRFMRLPCPTPVLNSFDVIVSVSGPIAQALRSIGCTRPLVLWSHHATDQPAVQPLHNPAERSLYAGFALVSQWHAETYATFFDISPPAIKVLRNAVSPAFLDTASKANWLKNDTPPVLGYTSTPYRGLDILLLSFASIRKQLEGASLRIFSGMGIYSPDIRDDFSSFYDLAHALPGVTYVGPLPQPRLAEAMTEIDIWAYPCTFAETSCISAMEAMASGTVLVSTKLGALPETTAGFAHLVDFGAAYTSGMAATRFAHHLVSVVAEVKSNPEAAQVAIARQIDFARTQYNWKRRASEWIEYLGQIA